MWEYLELCSGQMPRAPTCVRHWLQLSMLLHLYFILPWCFFWLCFSGYVFTVSVFLMIYFHVPFMLILFNLSPFFWNLGAQLVGTPWIYSGMYVSSSMPLVSLSFSKLLFGTNFIPSRTVFIFMEYLSKLLHSYVGWILFLIYWFLVLVQRKFQTVGL